MSRVAGCCATLL
ncbi:hypothetical protein LINPERHAP1_LOCUS3558 [Linum perenne]